MNRRTFLKNSGWSTCGMLVPNTVLSFIPKDKLADKSKLTFGIVADAHHGMLPDVNTRLEKFIVEAKTKDVDFIMQLGDFCHLEEKSKPFLSIWDQFKKNKYHVLGNHDMDLSSKDGIMDFWGMESNYYSFVEKGVNFLVLDANFLYQDGKFIDYNNSNFYVDQSLRTYITDEQIEWFGAKLANSDLPIIVISHQSLWHYQWGIKNRLSLQKLMEEYSDKIICCFNGHNHIDFHHYQNGIDYIEINSLSYQWIGENHKTSRYPKELLNEYRWLDHIAPYKDPLYAFIEIDTKGLLEMKGKKSTWMPPTPMETGVSKQVYGNEYSSVISDYTIDF